MPNDRVLWDSTKARLNFLPATRDFEVQIAHSVAEVDREVWDRLAGDSPFAGYRWYRYGEKVLADDQPIYITLFRQGKAIARATFWVTKYEMLEVEPKFVHSALRTFLRHRPLMMCRSPLSSLSGLILPDSPLRQAALETIVAVAREQARHYKASFLAFDFLAPEAVAAPGWPAGFAAFNFSEPGTRLVIEWPNFESYLRQHLTRSARKSYRKNSKRAAASGSVVKIHETVTDIDRAMALIQNVYDRYNTEPEPWMRRMLAYAHMVDATWVTAEIDGRIVGCELMLGDKDISFLTALGLDYSVRYIYFQLFYEDIAHAIHSGMRELRAGSTAYEVKQRMGFELVHNTHIIFAATNPVLHHLFRRFLPRLAQV